MLAGVFLKMVTDDTPASVNSREYCERKYSCHAKKWSRLSTQWNATAKDSSRRMCCLSVATDGTISVIITTDH